MKTSIQRMIAVASLVAAAMASVPATAQAQPTDAEDLTGFWITTPYPELGLRPGETETIALTLSGAAKGEMQRHGPSLACRKGG